MNYYPDSCDRSAIEALISDYLNDVSSDDENNHRNEGKAIIIKVNAKNHSKIHIKLIVAELLACCEKMSEGKQCKNKHSF